MNGRLYDPMIARFLSPDKYVQAPDLSQGYNRYTYCLNNPLGFSDPTGDSIFGFLLTTLGLTAGQYVINWLNNVINVGMKPKEAFQNTPIIIGMSFTIPCQSNTNTHQNAQQTMYAANYSNNYSYYEEQFTPSWGGLAFVGIGVGFGENMFQRDFGRLFNNMYTMSTEITYGVYKPLTSNYVAWGISQKIFQNMFTEEYTHYLYDGTSYTVIRHPISSKSLNYYSISMLNPVHEIAFLSGYKLGFENPTNSVTITLNGLLSFGALAGECNPQYSAYLDIGIDMGRWDKNYGYYSFYNLVKYHFEVLYFDFIKLNNH